MGQRRGPASMALILLVLGVLGMAVVAVAWWPLPDVLGGEEEVKTRVTTATVIEPAPCGASTEGDLLKVRIDGAARQARFDGCGHSRGQKLSVLVPVRPGEKLLARPAPAGSSAPENPGDLRDRVSWVLLTLSAVAGGGYVLLLRSRV